MCPSTHCLLLENQEAEEKEKECKVRCTNSIKRKGGRRENVKRVKRKENSVAVSNKRKGSKRENMKRQPREKRTMVSK